MTVKMKFIFGQQIGFLTRPRLVYSDRTDLGQKRYSYYSTTPEGAFLPPRNSDPPEHSGGVGGGGQRAFRAPARKVPF